jgi:HAD superfamily hydrolase (TIGR01509 family)
LTDRTTPAAVVFDFDGLILDTEVPEFVTVQEEFANHGLELRLEDWQLRLGRADLPHWIDQLEAELGAPIERDVVRSRRLEKHHALIHQEVIRPGVVAVLDQADALGIPAAVASSSTSAWVEGHLDRLGVLDRFARVLTRDHVEHAKPWPDLYLASVEAVGVPPSTAVALEDSHNGCIAAKAAGLFCVIVPNDMTRSQDFTPADLVVDSLADVTLRGLLSRSPA